MEIQIFKLFQAIVFTLYSYTAGSIIYQKKPSIKFMGCVNIVLYFVFFYVKTNLFCDLFALYFLYILYALNYKIIFKEKTFSILLGSMITLLIRLGIEMLYLLIGFSTYAPLHNFSFFEPFDVILLILEFFISLRIIYLFQKQIRKMIRYLTKNNLKPLIVLTLVYLNIFLVFYLSSSNYGINFILITEIIIIIIFSFIIFFYLNQEARMEKLTKYYEEVVEYCKLNEKLLNDYKMAVHENNNKLLIIKSMLSGKKKDLENYLNTIIEDEKQIQKNWINDLKYIPIIGVKNFIYFKLATLSDLGATLEIFISPELETLDVSSLGLKSLKDLYTILGVVLDNMIDAIKISKTKLVSIHLYKDNNSINGTFANSFSGVLDLDKIGSMGYSTKGKSRGVGLCLMDYIVKNNQQFTIHSRIIDNFFVQQINMRFVTSSKHHQKKTVYHQLEKASDYS